MGSGAGSRRREGYAAGHAFVLGTRPWTTVDGSSNAVRLDSGDDRGRASMRVKSSCRPRSAFLVRCDRMVVKPWVRVPANLAGTWGVSGKDVLIATGP